MNLFLKENILLQVEADNKNEALIKIAEFCENLNYVDDAKELYKAFLEREKEATTGFENGFAIPHARTKIIKEPHILFVTFKNPIEWESLDKQPATHAFILLVPENVNNFHIYLLSKISLALLDKKFVDEIKKSNDPQEIYNLINKFLEKDKTENNAANNLEQNSNNKLNVVSICACPAGIAHTYMAKEKIKKAAEELGWNIKIETRGAMTENILRPEDIINADYVLLAVDVKIDKEIFLGKKILEVSTNDVISDAAGVLSKLTSQAILYGEQESNNKQTNNQLWEHNNTKYTRKEKKKEKQNVKALKKQYQQIKKETSKQIKNLNKEYLLEKKQIEKQIKDLKPEDLKLQNSYKAEYLSELKKIKNQEISNKKNYLQNYQNKKQAKKEYEIIKNKLNIEKINLKQNWNLKVENLSSNNLKIKLKQKYDAKNLEYMEQQKNAYVNYYNAFKAFDRKQKKVFVRSVFTSIGYLIPIIVTAALMLAFSKFGVSVSVDPATGTQHWSNSQFGSGLESVANIMIGLIPAFLAMYIANAIGGKPALAPGFIGGLMISNSKIMAPLLLFDPNSVIPGVTVDENIVNGGFLGGMLMGYLVGLISKGISMINFPSKFRPIMALLFNPLITALIIFVLNAYIIGTPIVFIMVLIYAGLFKLTEFNNPGINIAVCVIFSVMINTDFGGPINKIAFFLSSAIALSSLTANRGDIEKSNYISQNAVQAAIAIGPLGACFSVWMFPSKFSEEEKIAGNSALIMGIFGISEGVLPFVFARPKKVIPAAMIGAAISGVLIGLLSTYNNLKFVAGIGSPIGGWIGYSIGTGYGFYWFLTVVFSSLVMAVVLGLSIEKNEIVYQEFKKNKMQKILKLQNLGYVTKAQRINYNLKQIGKIIKNKLKKLKTIDGWIIRY